MIAVAAVTEIGAQVDGGGLGCRDSVRLAGKALFLPADGEAGAHGADLDACGEAGKLPFPPCRVAVGRGGRPQDGGGGGWAWRGPYLEDLVSRR